MPLILLNKPYRVMSQFNDPSGRASLRDFVANRSVYPAGRLDYDSEGLLLLTDDGALQSRISHPGARLPKCYRVQVEGIATEAQLNELRGGVTLKDGEAAAVHVALIGEPGNLWERDPPIRVRKNVPDSWIELCITSGRNRQVRRMTAAVGLPTLRLIRYRIGPFNLNGLRPGETDEISLDDAWRRIARS